MLMLIQVAGNPAMSGADFNTSHVNVNLNSWDKKVCHKDNFNTSHVNVNLCSVIVWSVKFADFNTSHVNVNLIPIQFLQ